MDDRAEVLTMFAFSPLLSHIVPWDMTTFSSEFLLLKMRLLRTPRYFHFLYLSLTFLIENMNNVVVLIHDKCIANRIFSRLVGPHFVGCHIHGLKFAVKYILDEKEELIEMVQAVMTNLSYSIPAEVLRCLTTLSVKHANCTRWI